MPSALRSPKTLSNWLDLDYCRRPRLLGRLWLPACIAAALLAGLCAAFGFLPGQASFFQAGPVSDKHALFANDCSACHQGAFSTLGRFVRSNPNVRSVPDAACTACHAGAVHHTKAVGNQACASCHKEHRGHAALARIADPACTACHADLKRNDGRPAEFDPHVTAFAPGRHPEFRVWSAGTPKDPGTIRFNHAAHLVKDLPALGPGKRETLECQSCHEPDAAGRDMKPIRYEAHCRRCHPLGVRLNEEGLAPNLRAGAESFARTPAPHPAPNQTPEVVRGVLRDRLARFIREQPAFLKDRPRPEADDRAAFLFPRTEPPLTKEQFAWVGRQQGRLERQLFDGAGGCRYCHTEATSPASRPAGLPAYRPSAIPDHWFSHARFNHKSHRMTSCGECHATAGSTTAADVLLPRVDSCMTCHQSGKAGTARADCVTCHTYHDPRGQAEFRGTRRAGAVSGH